MNFPLLAMILAAFSCGVSIAHLIENMDRGAWADKTKMRIMQTLPDCQTGLESEAQKSYQESLAEIARLRLIVEERANE